jgi:hypothetical protein
MVERYQNIKTRSLDMFGANTYMLRWYLAEIRRARENDIKCEIRM